jgi:GR25 family glycosyltransferase involved in LPS biosynthesis
MDILNNYEAIIEKYVNGELNDNILNNLPIYIINLKKDIARRNYVINMMSIMKINFNLVTVDKISDNLYKKIYKNVHKQIINSKSIIGCALSHLYCLEVCLKEDYDKFLILEDDIIFHKSLNILLTEEILNKDYDMLMLGACDTNYIKNVKETEDLDNGLSIYKPKKICLGAHANLYKKSFAKVVLETKCNTALMEYDTDFTKFYSKYKIYVCEPNLVITELSTSNINHNFGFNFKKHNFGSFEKFLEKIFKKGFTYEDYKYITIDFMEYLKNNKDDNKKYDEQINDYLNNFKLSENIKQMIYRSLLNNEYSMSDIEKFIDY